jgi:hypothetical protein
LASSWAQAWCFQCSVLHRRWRSVVRWAPLLV